MLEALADQVASEFYALGIETMHGIAAAHRKGTGQLLDQVLAPYTADAAPPASSAAPAIAVIGRPNVSKSTLVISEGIIEVLIAIMIYLKVF